MPISSTSQIDSTGSFRKYNSTTEMSASGSSVYYKCATVDTEEETWTGYERLTSNIFGGTFSLTTTSLTYTDFPPKVSLIYDSTGQMEITMPLEKGCVFDASLGVTSATAKTGQALTIGGDVTYQTYGGIPSIYLDGTNNYIGFPDAGLPEGNANRTMCGWFYVTEGANERLLMAYGNGSGTNTYSYILRAADNSIGIGGGGSGSYQHNVANAMPSDGWYFILYTHNSSSNEEKLYVNNVLKDTWTMARGTSLSAGCVGAYSNDFYRFGGYIASTRIYNRVVSAEERATLYAEHSV